MTDFLATVGRGLDSFAMQHLQNVFHERVIKHEQYDGKLRFTIDMDHLAMTSPSHSRTEPGLKQNGESATESPILSLRFIERLFLDLGCLQLDNATNKDVIEWAIQQLDNHLASAYHTKLNLTKCQKVGENECSKPGGNLQCSNSIGTEIDEAGHCSEGEAPPPIKRHRPEAQMQVPDASCSDESKSKPTFRICCKKISASIGHFVSETFGWQVALEEPDVELTLHIGQYNVFLAMPLTSRSLADRSFIQSVGLRSTVCDVLLYLADIQPGYVVLDPMCGQATVLAHALHYHTQISVIGMDSNANCLQKAQLNFVADSAENRSVTLLRADATYLPVQSCCVNVIVSDLPFGQQHGNGAINCALLYAKCVPHFARVLRAEGKCVLLTCVRLLETLKMECTKNGLNFVCEHFLTLGRTKAVICLFIKRDINANETLSGTEYESQPPPSIKDED